MHSIVLPHLKHYNILDFQLKTEPGRLQERKHSKLNSKVSKPQEPTNRSLDLFRCINNSHPFSNPLALVLLQVFRDEISSLLQCWLVPGCIHGAN